MTPTEERRARLELIERIVAAVSHDFNNILAAVSMYAELVLLEGGVHGQAERDVEEILAAARRGAAMTAFLGVVTGERSESGEPLDLSVDLSHLRKILGRLLPDGVTVRVTAPDDPVTVAGDRVEFQRTLFGHAWDVAEELAESGGEVQIRAEREGVDVRIEVGAQPDGPFDRAFVLPSAPVGIDPAKGEAPRVLVIGDSTLARLVRSAGLAVDEVATTAEAAAECHQRTGVIVAPATDAVADLVRRRRSHGGDAPAWVLVASRVDVSLPGDLAGGEGIRLVRAPASRAVLVDAIRSLGSGAPAGNG